MKVIICGAGQVGYSIAQYLAKQNNDITVIELHSIDLTYSIVDYQIPLEPPYDPLQPTAVIVTPQSGNHYVCTQLCRRQRAAHSYEMMLAACCLW